MQILEKFRVFLSLNPSEAEKELLKADQQNVRSLLKDANIRWEDPEKFHLTLRFLGDIEADKIERLCSTLDRLKFDFSEIEYETTETGFFPDTKYPNVIFAGLKEINNHSQTLVEFIDKIIINFGVKPEKRFIPHITLGRFSRKKRYKLGSDIKYKLLHQKIIFASFFLMKSILTPEGSNYEIINEFSFLK